MISRPTMSQKSIWNHFRNPLAQKPIFEYDHDNQWTIQHCPFKFQLLGQLLGVKRSTEVRPWAMLVMTFKMTAVKLYVLHWTLDLNYTFVLIAGTILS